MKNILKRNWTDWVSIFVSALCYWLGDLKRVENNDQQPQLLQWLSLEWYNSFIDNRGYFLALLILFLIIIYVIVNKKDNFQKKWLQLFLRHLTEQHLSGGNYNTRITIFRVRRGWGVFIPHLSRWLRSKEYPFSAIPNPFKKYLTIYVRYCASKQPISYTFFRINEDIEKKSSSAVAECFRTNNKVSYTTDSIASIALPKQIDELMRTEKYKVLQYMRKSGIKDYDTLLSIHVKSNSLLALPIQHEDEKWGVIVFDHLSSENEPSINFNEKLSDTLLANYQKIVAFTTQLIK